MEKISSVIVKSSRGILVMILSVLYLSFPLYFLKQAAKSITVFTGDIPVLDLRMSYSVVDVFFYLSLLGTNGRELYSFMETVIDPLYMITYTVFFIFLIGFFLRRLRFGPAWNYLVYLPVLPFTMDALENICIFNMITTYPGNFDFTASAGSKITTLKWAFGYLVVVILLLLLVSFIVKTLGKKKEEIRISEREESLKKVPWP